MLSAFESHRETVRMRRVRLDAEARDGKMLPNVRIVRRVLPKRESIDRGNRQNARTDWPRAAEHRVLLGRVFALQEQVPDAAVGDGAREHVRVREEVLLREVSEG